MREEEGMSVKGWKRRVEGVCFVIFAPDEEEGMKGIRWRGGRARGLYSVLIAGGTYINTPGLEEMAKGALCDQETFEEAPERELHSHIESF